MKEIKSTSDSPSWTDIAKIDQEILQLQSFISQYSHFPFNIGICFRALEADSGWSSKARYYPNDNHLSIDIVTNEAEYISCKKDINAQRKIIGKEFHEFFPKTMKKYEKKFPVLKEINPTFLPQVEQWLLNNGWIDSNAD